ncbi:hypothetical protein ABZW18_13600 [Streptomyces sp. NPDC004647]|uniref:hypothetical protein n=1 Tax=Streptomyces sp. NPDC004647 TaxID=3154671 RepID=UPI0033BF0383
MGVVARRPVAAVAAALLFLEAIGIAVVHMILGIVVDRQDMSLAGLDPGAMSLSTWIAGALFGLYLGLCGFLLLRCAMTDRAPGRYARIALISCAVVHGVLGALTVGLVGWLAFAFMMGVFGLIVLSVVAYGERHGPEDAPAAPLEGPSPA